MQNETFDQTTERYKRNIKKFVKQNAPEVFAGAVTLGAIALWGFYMLGLKDGKRIYAHGPCVEVGHTGAQALLSGKFLALKVADGDVLYKIFDADPTL